MLKKGKKLTLKEEFFGKGLDEAPVDPAQHGEDIKKNAISQAIKDIAPYVQEDDPTIAALNNMLANATWEGGMPQASQVSFGEGLFGTMFQKDPKKSGDIKKRALATAVKDLKPNVPEGDPTIAALNDLLAKSTWEGGTPQASQIEFPKESKELQNECEECPMGGDEEDLDGELLLDEPEDMEPRVTSIGAPEIVIITLGHHADEIEDKEGVPAMNIGKIGAPGGPNFKQPESVEEEEPPLEVDSVGDIVQDEDYLEDLEGERSRERAMGGSDQFGALLDPDELGF